MEKFRILLLNSLNIFGGGEFYTLQLAKSLKKQGYIVWISCKKDSLLHQKCSNELIATFPLDYPENGKGKLFNITNQIKKFIKEKGIHIVHSNTNYDRTAGAFAAWLTNSACVATIHSYHSISHNLTHWIRNKYLVNKFIADSIKIKELLINNDKINASKVSLVNIGIDAEEMKRSEEAGKRIREELSIPEDAIVIGNVGRMVEFKGQEFLIKAFAQSRKLKPNLKLIITGDGKLKKDLLELADNIDVKEDIRFTGFRDDLASIYSSFDIYAHTSLEGGGELFPISILNALAQGLPVIASDAGDISSMVINGKNGYLIQPKNIEEISCKIVELAESKKLRTEFGGNAVNFFMENFTLDKMTSRITDVYNNL